MSFIDETAKIFLVMFGLVFPCPTTIIATILGTFVRKRNKKIEKIEQFEVKYKIQFIGEKEEFICMICKLEICSGDLVYVCPQCNSHYHDNHFLDWLQIETNCPVCEYKFPYLE